MVLVLELGKLQVGDKKVRNPGLVGIRILGLRVGRCLCIRRLPKRGFTNIFKKEYEIVNLAQLAGLETKNPITPEVMREKGIIRRVDSVKILGNGELSEAVTVHAQKFSRSAVDKDRKSWRKGSDYLMSGAAAFGNVFRIPELKKKVFFTLGILVVYRIGAHIPTPGINSAALAEVMARMTGTIMGFFDMFSGGALSRLTIFALGIMPYISASIILQLMTMVSPYLARLKKEGEQGQKKITQYTRYGTIVLSMIQSSGIAVGLEAMKSPSGNPLVPEPGWSFRVMTVLTLTAGTAFLMWLGEQITERGIGNGISLIIFAGIVAGTPAAIFQSMDLMGTGELSVLVMLFLMVFMAAVVGAIVFTEGGQRRISIQYAKRVVGRKMYGGQSTHLPLKVNTSGVIPPIFASSIIMFPATIAQFTTHPWMQNFSAMLTPGTIVYSLIFIGAIFFFCYFYTAVIFNPIDVADNMKKHGGFVPGIRPGPKTSEYIDEILSKITFYGAIYLSLVCILPDYLIKYINIPFYFGGTSLLIVVGVSLDTMQQIESHMVMRNYDGFLKKGRLKGRRG